MVTTSLVDAVNTPSPRQVIEWEGSPWAPAGSVMRGARCLPQPHASPQKPAVLSEWGSQDCRENGTFLAQGMQAQFPVWLSSRRFLPAAGWEGPWVGSGLASAEGPGGAVPRPACAWELTCGIFQDLNLHSSHCQGAR